jgi:GTP-binding protein Era
LCPPAGGYEPNLPAGRLASYSRICGTPPRDIFSAISFSNCLRASLYHDLPASLKGSKVGRSPVKNKYLCDSMEKEFRSGFVSIVGKPNVGKSTLMNALVGERLSIISPKAQTTRHRIMGIINGEDHQIIYSDTPGILEPKYALHEAMMSYVKVSLEDADLILLVVEIGESYSDESYGRFKTMKTPVVLVLNKIDTLNPKEVETRAEQWKKQMPNLSALFPISARNSTNLQNLLSHIVGTLPVHPPYFPTDELTNRSERFFASEIIREKIFFNYDQEIPYSSEIVVTEFKEEETIIRIRAEIFVERDSQKGILIGKGGSALKKVGTEAREAMESFFQKKVFLETHVKVAKDWRKERTRLKQFGYFE